MAAWRSERAEGDSVGRVETWAVVVRACGGGLRGRERESWGD